MATDINKQLAHQPRNVQELAKAAEIAWQTWDRRPSGKDGEDYARWQSAHKTAMNDLGAALMLFGLAGATDPRNRNSKPDPREHGPI